MLDNRCLVTQKVQGSGSSVLGPGDEDHRDLYRITTSQIAHAAPVCLWHSGPSGSGCDPAGSEAVRTPGLGHLEPGWRRGPGLSGKSRLLLEADWGRWGPEAGGWRRSRGRDCHTCWVCHEVCSYAASQGPGGGLARQGTESAWSGVTRVEKCSQCRHTAEGAGDRDRRGEGKPKAVVVFRTR